MSPLVSEEAARSNLAKIDHVVVLMMENRSFDHVLGYLKLDGVRPEVDGLEASMGNEDVVGQFHRVRPLGRRKIDVKVLDPGHGPTDVREQIAGGAMSGFLKNYVKAYERSSEESPLPPGRSFDPTLVLSYLRADDVPVYDYLARSFHVCDRWFSSVPGPTWPNRLYAATGGSDGTTSNRRPPLYDLDAFVRKLDAEDVSRRWYCYDHTSIIKTILLRFCKRSDSAVRAMGARVAAANHLGSLLTRPANRPRGRASDQQLAALVAKVAAWRRSTYRATTLGEPAADAAAREEPALTDLQSEVVAIAKRLRAAGLPPGEP